VPRESSLRASDADRDAVAEKLRVAAVEGRLSADELDERVGLALRARTYGDLSRLLIDLPVARPRVRRRATPMVASLVLRLVLAVAALMVIGAVLAVGAVWFALWAVVFLALRAGRAHRCHTTWHHPPRVRRI
jgi:Domain of unknown function (DUF1707)